MLGLTGLLLISAAVVWVIHTPTLKQYHPRIILGEAILSLSLGPAFYTCLFTGKSQLFPQFSLLCKMCSAIIQIIEKKKSCNFFLSICLNFNFDKGAHVCEKRLRATYTLY